MTRQLKPKADLSTAAAILPDQFVRWFAERGWSPRAHQIELLAKAQAGKSVLLIAPTGAGKTLAGFMPTLTDLADRPKRKPGEARRGIHTLYISPLKALAVDIERNLAKPVDEMGLPLTLETRTGDTPAHKRQRQKLAPPDILLTTPEQLALLIATSDAKRFFEDLRYVVFDELHSLVTSKRGHLAVARAGAAARHRARPAGDRAVGDGGRSGRTDAAGWWGRIVICPLIRLGLLPRHLLRDGEKRSPTLRPAHPLPLGRGRERSERVRGRMHPMAELITVAGGAKPDVSVLDSRERVPWQGHSSRYAIPEIYELVKAHKTTLLFVNTRSQAELLFAELWRINEDSLPIALHHGSLDVSQRRRVEKAMETNSLRAIVATSTLDLGIDWGDVDLVIHVGAPKGASRLAQRIGRANHRMDEPSKAILVPSNRFEVLECRAALEAIDLGAQDTPPLIDGALDVLAQHVLGVACGAPFDADELYDEVLHRRALCRARPREPSTASSISSPPAAMRCAATSATPASARPRKGCGASAIRASRSNTG